MQATIIRGRRDVLACEPLLRAFAESTGQQVAAHWLSYFASKAFHRRVPNCILLSRRQPGAKREKTRALLPRRKKTGQGLKVEDLLGIVLVDEFVARGKRTYAYSTDDKVGFRSVFALPHHRAAVVAAAAEALIADDAHVVYFLYLDEDNTERPEQFLGRGGKISWMSRPQELGCRLELAADYATTLSGLGKKTRFNLGYYRRRFEKEVGCQPVPDALAELDWETFQALHRDSRDPISDAMCTMRWKVVTTEPDSFVFGLRGVDGRWLGLIGGWRDGVDSVLVWQTNLAGLDKYSIGTVVRSYWMEHECERGARSLVFHNGTPHSLSNHFRQSQVREFAVRRDSLWARLLAKASRFYLRRGTIVLQTPIAVLLRDETADWKPQRRSGQRRSIQTLENKTDGHATAGDSAPAAHHAADLLHRNEHDR